MPTLLRRIADTLSIPVEQFFTDKPFPEAAARAEECLQLWSKIATEEGRQRALEALRSIAEREEA